MNIHDKIASVNERMCPLCDTPGTLFAIDLPTKRLRAPRRAYCECHGCGAVFVPPSYRLPVETEYLRYRRHDNHTSNEAYVAYQLGITREFVLPNLPPPPAEVLELGGGPAPLVAQELQAIGYRVAGFDPAFAPNAAVLERRYDAIVAIEVIEHLREPRSFFEQIGRCRRTGGIVMLQTHLWRGADAAAFVRWHYRSDPTHIVFYRLRTMQRVAELLRARLAHSDNAQRFVFAD